MIPASPRPGEVVQFVATVSTQCWVDGVRTETLESRILVMVSEPCSCVPGPPYTVVSSGYTGPFLAGTYTLELIRVRESAGDRCGPVEHLARADLLIATDGEPGRIAFEPWPLRSEDPVILTLRTNCPAQTSADAPVVDGNTVSWVEHYNSAILAPCTDQLVEVAKFQIGRLGSGIYRLKLYTLASDVVPNPPFEPSLETSFVVHASEPLVLARRFEVTAVWRDAAGVGREAASLALTENSAAFWFFDADNVELIVKAVDGCEVNGRTWIFAAGLTDVGVELLVRDSVSGAVRTYVHEGGAAFQPRFDVDAFGESCEPAALSARR